MSRDSELTEPTLPVSPLPYECDPEDTCSNLEDYMSL